MNSADNEKFFNKLCMVELYFDIIYLILLIGALFVFPWVIFNGKNFYSQDILLDGKNTDPILKVLYILLIFPCIYLRKLKKSKNTSLSQFYIVYIFQMVIMVVLFLLFYLFFSWVGKIFHPTLWLACDTLAEINFNCGGWNQFQGDGSEIGLGYYFFLFCAVLTLVLAFIITINFILGKKRILENNSKKPPKISENVNQSSQKQFTPTKIKKEFPASINPNSNVFSKSQLLQLHGMIKAYKSLDLNMASNFLKVPKEQIMGVIFELIGKNEIQGSFEGDIFTISSDIQDFITTLDQSFGKWAEKEENKDGKIE
jgi:hypothetical protein